VDIGIFIAHVLDYEEECASTKTNLDPHFAVQLHLIGQAW
jgi:hypothetical protein